MKKKRSMPLPSMTCSVLSVQSLQIGWNLTGAVQKMSLHIKTSPCISAEVHSVYPCFNKVRAIFAYLTTKVNPICAEFTIKVSPIIKRYRFYTVNELRYHVYLELNHALCYYIRALLNRGDEQWRKKNLII